MVKTRQIILLLGDVIIAGIALLLTIIIGFWGNFTWEIFWDHVLPFCLLYFSWILIFYIFGLYELNFIRPRVDLLLRLSESFFACLLLGAAFFYLIPLFKITPKANLLIDIVIFTILIFGWRRLFCALFSNAYQQSVAFLGKNSLADVLIKEFESQPQLGYKFNSFLNPRKPLIQQIKNKKIDLIVLVEDITENPKLIEELYKSLPLKISLTDLSDIYELIFKKIPIDFVDHSWFLKNLKEGQKKVYDNLKRLEDIVFGCLIILLTTPCWLLFPIFIKLEDKDSVFYKQKRIGKDKEIFFLYKFRSMRTDAEKNGEKWADKKDDRITKIGSFMRKTHLDEVPQMLNVLKGDISLVGPRPERPIFVRKLEKEIPHYHLRHIIKSGFTGWAQINFRYARSVMDSHEKFQYDLYYIKNRSLLLDLGCLLKTFYIFFKKNYT